MNLKYLIKEFKYYKQLGALKNIIYKFLFAKTPLSKSVNKPLYSKLYSNKIKHKIKHLNPGVVQIENTNYCNAKCIMCPHVVMKRKKKHMSLDDFKKILSNTLSHHKASRLIITGFGEPLIDPGVIEKIKFVNQSYPESKIEIYTNASVLTQDLANKILQLKIHKINFSVNGTKRLYQKIMGLNYDNTEKNILHFLKQKKDQKLKYPLTNISLMVMKDNEKDVNNFLEQWKNKSDSIMVYSPSNWAGKLKIDTVTNAVPFPKKRWPCLALFKNITVDVDGNVIMCCRDYESVVKFGNLKKQTIKQIRSSPKFQTLLDQHKDHNFSAKVCNTCDNCFDSSLEWWAA